ncbi:MAG: 3'-5' exoribonuclease [Muribaculaceae bacterium]|nr:3'-5' exoribonuclease [Muribaculaceae bacterium]
MKDFAAIDFETANRNSSSICSVGVVIVRGGEVKEKIYRLVHPAPNYYSPANVSVHGLTNEDTDCADYFPEVWAEIHQYIEDLPLVAHFSRFDEGCLKAAFRRYQMTYPNYSFYCTCNAARRVLRGQLPNFKLPTVSAYCGYDLEKHHHALADAEAAAMCVLGLQRITGMDFEEM